MGLGLGLGLGLGFWANLILTLTWGLRRRLCRGCEEASEDSHARDDGAHLGVGVGVG